MNPRVLVGAATAVSIAAALASSFEGERLTPYSDVTGVLTVCDGHTGGVENRAYSADECKRMLQTDMQAANRIANGCVRRAMPIGVEAAVSDFVFNVGYGRAAGGRDSGKDGFCVLKNGEPSTMLKMAWAGNWPGVCAQFMYWTTAGGVQYAGLVKRRQAEKSICEGSK